MARVKTLSVSEGKALGIEKANFPSIHISGSIRGMKEQSWGKGALVVKCGSYYYNVNECPDIYYSRAY